MTFAPGGAANGSSLAAQTLPPSRYGYCINSGSYWNSFFTPAAVLGSMEAAESAKHTGLIVGV